MIQNRGLIGEGRAEVGGGFSGRVIWNAVHDTTYRQEGTLDRDTAVWDVCVVDKSLRWRCAGRLRYLELIAGGFRDNLDV